MGALFLCTTRGALALLALAFSALLFVGAYWLEGGTDAP